MNVIISIFIIIIYINNLYLLFLYLNSNIAPAILNSKLIFSPTVLHIWQMNPLHLFHSFHTDLPLSWLFRNRFLEPVLHLPDTYSRNSRVSCTDGCSGGFSRPAGGAVLTLSPECYALLLVCLADAVVTVSIYTLAGVSVMQVDISRALRVGTCAKLRQVTGVTGFTAWSPCRFQLYRQTHHDVLIWMLSVNMKLTV